MGNIEIGKTNAPQVSANTVAQGSDGAQSYFNERGQYAQPTGSSRENPFWSNDALLRRSTNHRLLRRQQAGRGGGSALNGEAGNETQITRPETVNPLFGAKSGIGGAVAVVPERDMGSAESAVGWGGAGGIVADGLGVTSEQISQSVQPFIGRMESTQKVKVQPDARRKKKPRVQPDAQPRKRKESKRIGPPTISGHGWKPSGLTGWELYERKPAISAKGNRSSKSDYVAYYSQKAIERLHNAKRKT